MQVNFDLDGEERLCTTCSSLMVEFNCSGQKTVATCDQMKLILVKHFGMHECVAQTRQVKENITGHTYSFLLNLENNAYIHNLGLQQM